MLAASWSGYCFFSETKKLVIVGGKSIELKSGRQTVTDLKKRKKSETKDEVCVLPFNMKEQIKACWPSQSHDPNQLGVLGEIKNSQSQTTCVRI